MKIALLTSFPVDPSAPRGGVEAVSVNLVAALASHPGLEVHVITVDRPRETRSITRWCGATVHRLPMGGGRLLSYVLKAGRARMADYLQRLAPDVIHAHDFYGMMVKGFAMPRVFTVHGFIHEDTKYGGGKFAWLRAQLWKRFEVASWAEQPHIISISPYVRERLRGLARGVIHDIENPIDAGVFEIQRDERPGTIFSAAAISQRKNTLGLVRAFAKVRAQHPNAQLRLAGHCPEPAYGAAVQSLIVECCLSDAVHQLGSISTPQIREEFSHASIFALPSFEEGAPMGIAEAMAARVPVVTSNRCGMPFMVRHDETGWLIEPEDTDDLAARLSGLLANVESRRTMGETARALALEKFHPQRVADKTLAVYEQALGASKTPVAGNARRGEDAAPCLGGETSPRGIR